ncbi:hypothetical protein ACNKHU_07295 [Shigella flexneri]
MTLRWMVSPAPTSNTVTVEIDSKICRASVQAAKATEAQHAGTDICFSANAFRYEKDFWNMRSSSLAFIWPFCESANAFLT